MEKSCTNLTETARSVQQFKIDGFSTTETMTSEEYAEISWNFDGFDWEVHLYPAFLKPEYGYEYGYGHGSQYQVALEFIFLGGARISTTAGPWRTKIGCQLINPRGNLDPSDEDIEENSVSKEFTCGDSEFIFLTSRNKARHVLNDDCLTVECRISMLKELKRVTIQEAKKEVPLAPPPSDLNKHLGELLRSQKGADVTFTVSGESFAAHKLVLAARSPVFMAQFFGSMEERCSKAVEIEDMDPIVFKAMLQFIYTDTAPELDEEPDEAAAAATMVQHLLAAADRYGLERLKLMCEGKLSGGIDVDTAATTLALAEQHNCSLLKNKCVEFITESPETLDAVLATEGYKHLVASCPLVLTDLLKAAYGRKS